MIKVSHVDTYNFHNAIRGMRNPLNSWGAIDSVYDIDEPGEIHLGDNDLALARRLYRAGTEHRKFLRQIFVSMDVTAPLYWWKEADQYKVGTTTNSCSTMHTLTREPITLSNFSIDDFEMMGEYKDDFLNTVDACDNLRRAYVATKDTRYWRCLIQLLPNSFNQTRTLTMNYEVVANILRQRSNHKLQEWRDFCAELRKLPWVEEIMFETEDDDAN